MATLRKKASIKCECGKAVAEGSVFCPFCRAAIKRRNAKTMLNEGLHYEKEMRRESRGHRK